MRAVFSAVRTLVKDAVAGPSQMRFNSSAASESSYPFSQNAVFPPSTLTSSPSQPPLPSLLRPRNGASLISHLNNSLVSSSPSASYLPLFSRRHPSRLRTGSVLTVVAYTSASRQAVQPFSGVLMRVRRRGVDTSFTLRNVVQKTGVEMNFKVMSPMIKEIKVVRAAEGRTGGIRDLRRARVNYLRERPGLMTQIAGALKAARS